MKNVRGDSIHGGTVFTPTNRLNPMLYPLWMVSHLSLVDFSKDDVLVALSMLKNKKSDSNGSYLY